MSFLSAYGDDYGGDPAVVGNLPVESYGSASAGGDSFGGWNDVLKGAFTYGIGRWIDSETRQPAPSGAVPGMYGVGAQPITSTGVTAVSNKTMLIVGAVMLGALVYVLVKK
jgi:hypothetical protein